MMLFAACVGSSIPQGNLEKDAVSFVVSFCNCYKEKDIEKMSP